MQIPNRHLRKLALVLSITVLVIAPSLLAEKDNWPQFRGPDGMPVGANPNLPTKWSTTENVEWVADIPGLGWSSPIVWDGKIFVTTATSSKVMKQPSLGVDFSNDYIAELMKEGKSQDEVLRLVNERDSEMPDEIQLKYHLFCLDLETGRTLWTKEYYSGAPPVGRHRKNSFTSETPATDGTAVYVYTAFLGLWAFDFDGKALWNTPLEPHQVYLDFGGGASPVVHGDRVFILNDNQEASFLAAYDKKTGEALWRAPRPGLGNKMLRSGWSTPFVWENKLRTEVVTSGPGWIISYDVEGRELWRMSRNSVMAIQSPFAWDGMLFVTSGQSKTPNKPITAILPGGSGDITPPEGQKSGEHVVWYNRTAGGSYLPTPVLYDAALYVVSDKGIFSRVDALTGEPTYKSRIHNTAYNFTSSPWAYNGMVFCLNEEGNTFVIKAGNEFELLGINALDEFVQATPAIVGDRLLIRTQTKLYSIREN